MPAPADIPAILLAAGRSRRMLGRDKLLEDVDGVPLLRRQARMLRAVTTGDVIVALPPRPHPRYAALDGLDVTCLPIPDADEGMNASLRTAFGQVRTTAPAALLLLGDLPDITEGDIRTVLQSVDFRDENLIWRGATSDGHPGHPIVFARALFPEICALQGDSGGREVVRAAKGRVQLVPLPGQRARADLDTPEEWAKWRAAKTRKAGPE